MAKEYTAEQMTEARWHIQTAIDIRQDARAYERKRLTSEAEVLARVPEADRARFVKAQALHSEITGAGIVVAGGR